MLCYTKKCPTIYVKIDTVYIITRAAFGFKSILQSKKKKKCCHMAALLALIHTHKMLSSFLKNYKIHYIHKNTIPHKRVKSFLFLCST